MKRNFSSTQTQRVDLASPRARSLPHSALSSQALTPDESLSSLSIQHWLDNFSATPPPETMATPPTLISASSNNRGRHAVKRQTRSQGSRTPSPSKKPEPRMYRLRNMYSAGVLVNSLSGLPPAVDEAVRRVLGLAAWDEPVQTDPQLAGLAATFQAESQLNARECSLEGEWKHSLYTVVRRLATLRPEWLKTHISKKGKLAGAC